MSDYEHKRGKLELVSKDKDIFITEFLRNREIPEYCTPEEYFYDEYDEKYFVRGDYVYRIVDLKNIDSYDDIYTLSDNLEFECKYYNGGCSFNEALGSAFDNKENK